MDGVSADTLMADLHFLACATQGNGGDDETRLRDIVSAFRCTVAEFSKHDKRGSARKLLGQLKKRNFDLLVLEGTGIAGGIVAILGRRLYGMPYVVSSGDAVAPFLAARHPAAEPIFRRYEQMLYTYSSGFIGWTPYLVGRALTMGATRGITIPGWAPFRRTSEEMSQSRRSIRQRLGIGDETVVFGIAGSLTWSSRYQYCYGAELVRAARKSQGRVAVVIVGDGSGLPKLRELAGDAVDRFIHLPGRVPRDEVPGWLAACDVGSIPQSVDGVGSFRYTTKLSEYMAANLPFVTNQVPMAYDLEQHTLWRLPGQSPWDPVFLDRLAALMDTLVLSELSERRRTMATSSFFNRLSQIARVTMFLRDIVEAEHLLRRSS